MKYVVEQSEGGNIIIASEWTDKAQAIQSFHSVCSSLWAESSVTQATVKLFDEKLDVVDGKIEIIDKSLGAI